MSDMKEVRLTDDVRKRLRDSVAFTIDAMFKYVPRAYRGYVIDDDGNEKKEYDPLPKSLWPVFVLKARDGIASAESEDELKGCIEFDQTKKTVKADSPKTGAIRTKTVTDGLYEIKNLPVDDGSGRPIEEMAKLCYDRKTSKITIGDTVRENVTEIEVLRYMNPALQTEIANAITRRSTLTEDELRGLE